MISSIPKTALQNGKAGRLGRVPGERFKVAPRSMIQLTNHAALSLPFIILLTLPGFAETWTPHTGADRFAETVPAGWRAKKGNLETSTQHWREGAKSLRWEWAAGDWIKVTQVPYARYDSDTRTWSEWTWQSVADALSESRVGYDRKGNRKEGQSKAIFRLWLFQETAATDGTLTIWLKEKGVVSKFDFYLGKFSKSWRGIQASTEQFVSAQLPEHIQLADGEIAIAAPASGKGTLYLDRCSITPGKNGGPRDAQTSWLPVGDYHWHYQYEALQFKPTAGITATTQEVADVDALLDSYIKHELLPRLNPNRYKSVGGYVAAATHLHKLYGLKRHGDYVKGAPMGAHAFHTEDLLGDVRLRVEFSSDWRGPYGLDNKLDSHDVTQRYGTLFMTTLLACYFEPSDATEQMLIDVVDYLHYNGFEEGSSSDIDYLHYYTGFNWPIQYSVLCKDVLKKHGRLERFRRWARYASVVGDMYDERSMNDRGNVMNSTDVYGAATPMRLAAILLDEDAQRRAIDVKYFLRLLRKQLEFNTNGNADLMKPDHSVWHHSRSLLGYWGRNMSQRTERVIQAIKDSPFASNADFQIAYQRHVQALQAQAAYSNRLETFTKFFAKHEVLKQGVEHLPLYAAIDDVSGDAKVMTSHNWAGVAAYLINGDYWSWSGLTRPNRLETPIVKYDFAGSFPQGRKIRFDGWNPNYMPGATVPLDAARFLKPKGKNEMADEERQFTGSIEQRAAGIMAYRSADERYPDLRGVHSKFVFDDVMLCLGAGIANEDGVQVVTTLAQTPAGDQLIKTSPTSNRYYDTTHRIGLFTGASLVNTTLPGLSLEELAHYQSGKPAPYEGKRGGDDAIQVLYFDHGTKPKEESYQYGIVFSRTRADFETRMAAVDAGEAPKVLSNTATLQAVAHKDQVAIAAFDAVKDLDGFAGITAINQPGLVMLRDLEGGKTEVSFVDPRVLIVNPASDYFRTGSSQVRKIRLTFAFPIALVESNIKKYQSIHASAQSVEQHRNIAGGCSQEPGSDRGL